MNQHTYVPPCSKEDLELLYFSGKTQHEIAVVLCTTQKRIWKAMKHFGITSRVAAKRDQRGEKNHMWKGDKSSYSAFHFRIERMKGRPKKCEACSTTNPRKTYDWANMTGKYDDPEDYRRLCRSCHWKLDKKILNIHRMRKRGA